MKFGRQLEEAIYPEWQLYYISYNSLKTDLRIASNNGVFTDKNETDFVEKLDKDLEKVNAFHQVQLTNIQDRINTCSQAIESLIPSENSEAETTELQEEINQIADDINRLARFSKINYTAVIKLVKKHDRHTPYVLRPLFMVRIKQCNFWRQNYDPLLLHLSQLFNKVRSGSQETMSFKPNNMGLTSTVEGGPTNIVLRFFVHPDDILELKTQILRHLPVLVYNNSTTKGEDIDPPISSLYFDNSELDTYTARVENAPGSQLLRMRWYGSADGNTDIYFEKRTLQSDAMTEKNERFVIKDKYVDGFIKGDDTFIVKTAKKIRSNPGMTEEDAISFEKLAREVQEKIKEDKLAPVLRSYYRRTAFQVPGDRSVRVSLDTDICFIREDSQLFSNDQKIRRPEGKWHRPDVDVNYPFDNLTEDQEISHFPYAQLEIKMELPSPDSKVPRWVQQITQSEHVEEAHNFTKFVHGISIMFDQRVSLLPFWLAHVDTDVNRLPMLMSQAAYVGSGPSKGKQKDVAQSSLNNNYQSTQISPADESTSLLPRSDASSSTAYSGEELETTLTPLSAWTKAFFDKISNFFSEIDGSIKTPAQPVREPVVLPPGVKVPAKVITPLRVEPKVYFANERTYFSWMSFATLLATFSIALFNAGDTVGRISGVVYTLVSLSTFLYGMGLYYRRRELINARVAGPYDDMSGPTAICVALLFAVGLNAYLKFSSHGPVFLYL
ncbi:VTC domain-containing protein [Umbelopsis sp. PMI_123]|nr:VTC domain-containing protein [Umbelopsis sp. PMI_123]